MSKPSILRFFILPFGLLSSLAASALPINSVEVIGVDCCIAAMSHKTDSTELEATKILNDGPPIKQPLVITRLSPLESWQTQRQMPKAADSIRMRSNKVLPSLKHHIRPEKLQVRKDQTYLPFPVIM